MNITISNNNKIKKGTQLLLLNWPNKQAFKKDDIEKVPSWLQKGTQLLRKYVITEQGKSFLSGQFVISNS